MTTWRHNFAFTGQLHEDGTWEILPQLAHRALPESVHFVLCWLVGLPHLVTVDPNCGIWFKRWWLVRLSWNGWKFQGNWHLYPNAAPKGESFGCHSHPLNAATFLFSGGYDHLVKPGMRNGGTAPSFIQRVSPFRGWVMSSDDGHRVERMKGMTRSIFFMWGKAKEWFFEPGETKGSSRILRYTKPAEPERHLRIARSETEALRFAATLPAHIVPHIRREAGEETMRFVVEWRE